MTGLIYRKDKVAEPESINAIFDPKLKGKVTMLTEMRDTVGLTMLGMGMDPSKATLDQANQALDKVDKANRDGQIRRFTGNEYIRDLPKGDSDLVYGWSGRRDLAAGQQPEHRVRLPGRGRHALGRQHADPDRRAARMDGRGVHELRLRPGGPGAARRGRSTT